MKQHAGVAAQALVKPRDAVKKGQVLADVPEGTLGARVHASVDGWVERVDDQRIVLRT